MNVSRHSSAPGADRWALVGVELIDPATTSVRRGGVLIEGGLIIAAGPEVGPDAIGTTEAVARTGQFVMPGLIDTHIHLAFDGGPRPVERYLEDGIDPGLPGRMADAARAALESGATTIRDLGGPNEASFELRDRLLDDRLGGPRLVAAGLVVSPPGGHCHFIAQQTSDRIDLIEAVRSQLDAGADCIKVMVTGGVHTPGASGADVYYNQAALTAAADLVHARGRRITGHATNTAGIERAILAGFDSIQHGSTVDDRLARVAADHGIILVPTLSTHAAMEEHLGDPDIPAYVAAAAERGSAGKVRAARAAVAAGVSIAAGTDGGVTFVGHGALARELELLRDQGLGAMETLAAATSIAAVEVGLVDRIGRIAPGYEADLVVLERNPLADIRALVRPAAVIRAGIRRIPAGAVQTIGDVR
ncbi:MAG: amidohydrolase family protein [Candidatus Limnocylindrales bacterium]